MEKKTLFSKKGVVVSKKDILDLQVRRRVCKYLKKLEKESHYKLLEKVNNDMLMEHGWAELRSNHRRNNTYDPVSIELYMTYCEEKYLFDLIEVSYDIHYSYLAKIDKSLQSIFVYNSEINRIFKESKLPWRLLDDRIVK